MSDEGTMNVTADGGSSSKPGGDSPQGHAGDRDSSSTSGNGNTKGNNGVKNVPRDRADAISRTAGIDPGIFNYYYINEDGDLIGVSSLLSVGFVELNDFEPGGINLGPAPADLLHDYGNSGKGTSSSNSTAGSSASYKGDISDARIAALNKTIADNAKLANSTQSGQRIRKAKQATKEAQAELAVINYVRQKQAAEQAAAADAQARAEAEARTRAEAEARAKAEAEAKAKAEAEARAKAEAEAKAKAEAEARAKAQAELNERTKATFEEMQNHFARIEAEENAREAYSKAVNAYNEARIQAREVDEARNKALNSVGLQPQDQVPGYFVPSVNELMKAAGAMTFNRAAHGGFQMAVAGEGTLVTSGAASTAISNAISRGVSALLGASSLSAAAIVAGFWPAEAGKGSDQVPGRDVAALFTVPVSLLTGSRDSVKPGMKTVDMPVRGALVMDNGRLALKLMKTGDGKISRTVQVLEAKRDQNSGLDSITVPAQPGRPARNILVNPYLAEAAQVMQPEIYPGVLPGSDPLNPVLDIPPQVPVPAPPLHTGTEIKPVDNIQITTTPGTEDDLRDFIYWQLDDSETGVEPVYVMLNEPYGKTNAKGEYSGRDYNKDNAGGPIQNLDWRGAEIDREGIDKVKLHTGRFNESDANKVMIDRLEKILKGEIQATDVDKRFYTHEVRELERYRNLGIKDGKSPESIKKQKAVWNDTHTASLEDYKINEKDKPLYTEEALEAAYKQELKDAIGGTK
ncbi:S-type pyocin domain-containing protein [Pantoea sp. BAV 3049]|uniref:S-type pyocin domain-containing protein n=1 Tax=Pantoea sp. BAV 3049 TaxID=2654188 RepID=UPI001E4279C6|nr:S-type pyocin domain-containing protein [Pantoea sp. BAV 3049]